MGLVFKPYIEYVILNLVLCEKPWYPKNGWINRCHRWGERGVHGVTNLATQLWEQPIFLNPLCLPLMNFLWKLKDTRGNYFSILKIWDTTRIYILQCIYKEYTYILRNVFAQERQWQISGVCLHVGHAPLIDFLCFSFP